MKTLKKTNKKFELEIYKGAVIYFEKRAEDGMVVASTGGYTSEDEVSVSYVLGTGKTKAEAYKQAKRGMV